MPSLALAAFGWLLLAPLQDADKKFEEKDLGYSMSYPDSLEFVNDKPFLEKVGSDFRWFLFCYKRGSNVEFNSNLSLLAIKLDEKDAIKDMQAYMQNEIKILDRSVKDPKVSIDPTPVTVNGKEYMKVLYTHGEEGKRTLTLQYCYYSAKRRVLYFFTITDRAANDLKNSYTLEKVFETVKIED